MFSLFRMFSFWLIATHNILYGWRSVKPKRTPAPNCQRFTRALYHKGLVRVLSEVSLVKLEMFRVILVKC
jgi:hypothetical protein